jgi:putative intracellular protease/amidase
MKRLFFLFVLFSILVSCNKEVPKVLLFIRDGSPQLEYMLTNEVGIMSEILKVAGFEVTIATISGEVLKTDSITLTPDLKLSEVNIDDYAGFLLPCMAAGDSLNSETVAFVKEVAKKSKPLAAQTGSIVTLAKAGVLSGKKFAFVEEEGWNAKMYPEFNDGIYSGNDVIQDGIIITSGTCPWMARMANHQDGTTKLTLAMINVIKSRPK